MRFLGEIEAKTDAKGRVFLPASFRKMLQASGEEVLVMRKDFFQDCLVLYPESVWNEQMDTMRSKLSPFNPQHQRIYRKYMSEVEVVTLDGNGRLLIPRRYLEIAEIKQDVRFIGMGKNIEIWAREKIEEGKMENEEFGKALAEVMSDGINTDGANILKI